MNLCFRTLNVLICAIVCLHCVKCQTVTCSDAFECNNTMRTSGYNLDCAGYKSCFHSPMITLDNDISCEGSRSCQHGADLEGREFYCRGSSSCAMVEKMIPNIWWTAAYCYGSNSCRFSSYMSGPYIIYCDGVEACADSLIVPGLEEGDSSSRGEIYGTGAYSLSNAKIRSNGVDIEVTLRGYYSGYKLTIICEYGDNCDIWFEHFNIRSLSYHIWC